jgi:hypothetical protein
MIQQLIPGQGRFDDSFNINCIGDTFHTWVLNTVIRNGSFQSDYEREETRKYVFVSLCQVCALCENDIVVNRIDDYLNIPQNKVVFMI